MSDDSTRLAWIAIGDAEGLSALRARVGAAVEQLRWAGSARGAIDVLPTIEWDVAVVVVELANDLEIVASLAGGQHAVLVLLAPGADRQLRRALRRDAIARGAAGCNQLAIVDPDVFDDLIEAAATRRDLPRAGHLVQVEQALDETRARLDAALDAGDAATWLWDIVGQKVRVDRSLTRFFRLSIGEHEDPLAAYLNAVHEDDRQYVREAIGGVLLGGGTHYAAEFRVVGDDGQLRWVLARGRIERDPSGRPLRMSGVVLDVTERKRVSQALAEAERFLRRVLDVLLAYVAVLGPDGTVIDCNRRALEAGGLTLDEVRGVPLWACPWWSYDPAISEQIREACARAGAGERVAFDAEARIVDDGRLTVAFLLEPLTDEHGDVTHLVASGVDVSERVAAARDLAASRATLDAVLEALPVAVLVAEPSGHIIRENAANRELWGVAPETHNIGEYNEWVGWWPETGERIGADEWAMARTLLDGERVRNELVEYQPFDRDEHRFFLNNAAPIYDNEGRIVAGVVAQLDVTERLAVERQLHESELRFRMLADNIPQLAWMTDATGYIFWYNQRWFEYTGRTHDEMKGWGWQSVHHPDHVERVTERFKTSLLSGDPWEDTFPLRGADGRYRWFLSRAQPIRDERGEIVRWFGTNTDITAQRESEQVLRNAISLRDDFLAVASHELRTPLMTLGLQLEMLERTVGGALDDAPDDPAPRQVRKRLDVSLRQTRRLARLVEGLLDVSRIASGQLVLRFERCNLMTILEEVVERHSELASRSGTEVRLFARPQVEGWWDCSRIEQVVTNLLTNAIKYGRGAPVDISLAVHGDQAEITVRDRGEGVADEDHERIFERFERAAPTRHYGGLGLGLFIVDQIIEAHGGKVRVESSIGQGASFIVELPLDSRPVDIDETASHSRRFSP